jgi:hypothetical protein
VHFSWVFRGELAALQALVDEKRSCLVFVAGVYFFYCMHKSIGVQITKGTEKAEKCIFLCNGEIFPLHVAKFFIDT